MYDLDMKQDLAYLAEAERLEHYTEAVDYMLETIGIDIAESKRTQILMTLLASTNGGN